MLQMEIFMKLLESLNKIYILVLFLVQRSHILKIYLA
jgi:hypothetical protein